jgi:hypothetical protein
MPAFTLKIIGAILLGYIYQYYYKGGDTLNYWHQRMSLILHLAIHLAPGFGS